MYSKVFAASRWTTQTAQKGIKVAVNIKVSPGGSVGRPVPQTLLQMFARHKGSTRGALGNHAQYVI